jgi:hypothetical protein
MSKHTPGPWQVEKESGSHSITNRSFEGDEWCIAEVYKETDMAMANANLIAAAPDLLEALIDVRRALEMANFTGELAVVDAAIARAKGESK